MPWTCPAYGSPIQHNVAEARRRFGVRYRCDRCRRVLVMDFATRKLVQPADEPSATYRCSVGDLMREPGYVPTAADPKGLCIA
jgi:hypothetical protein